MRIKLLSLCVLMSIVLSFSGCATIVSGPRQQINLRTSNGQEVKATITSDEGVKDVILPTVFDAKRANRDILIDVKETSTYEPSSTVIRKRVNSWVWVDFLFWIVGPFATTTDYASGSLWQYDDTVIVPVQKKSGK